MKVLIADDDQDQLAIRTLLVANSGFEAISASTKAVALREAARRKPECAVVDLRFPTEESGLSLIRSLKTLDQTIEIFLLTGADAKRVRTLPEAKHVKEVILKGSPVSYLLNCLRELADPLCRLRGTLARDGCVTIDVKAYPRSERSEVAGFTADGAMKIRISAVAEKGKANEELRDVLAATFKVPKKQVELILGESSQRKRVRIVR